MSVVPASGMVYVQNECRGAIVGFLHTYGLAWAEDTARMNTGEVGAKLFSRLYISPPNAVNNTMGLQKTLPIRTLDLSIKSPLTR